MKRLLLLQLFLLPFSTFAQSPSINPWELLGPFQFAALAQQGQSTVVATTTEGYLCFSNDFGNTWRHVPLDDTMQLGDIKFFDSLHGIVNAASGSTNNLAATIFITQDGGATWSRIHIPLESSPLGSVSSTVHRLAFPSIDTFYACDGYGLVWRTTNEGKDWDAQMADTNALNDIHFFDSKTGFIIGNDGCFSKTTDAGEHWTRQNIGAGDSTQLFSMSFINRNQGVVIGFGYSYITTDGGSNWLYRPTPVSGHGPLYTVSWMNDNQFFAFGTAGQVYNLNGIASDMTVTLLDSIIYTNVSASLWSSEFGGLLVGYGGLIMHSTDGNHWKVESQYGGSAGQLTTYGNAYYSLAADGSWFNRSMDGGSTWQTCSFGTNFYNSNEASFFHFTDSLHATAFNSTRFSSSTQTSDGGLTWQNAGLQDLDPKYFYQTGLNGPISFSGELGKSFFASAQCVKWGYTALIRTTDDGRSWAKLDTIPPDWVTTPYQDAKPFEFAFTPGPMIDDLSGFGLASVVDSVIGQGARSRKYHSLLYTTSDGGMSWIRVQNYPLVSARAVYFRNKENGIVGCDSGILYRTNDDGSSWVRFQLPMTSSGEIRAINFFDSLRGYIGTGGVPRVFVTSDGGETWQDDSLYGGNVITALLFPDPNSVLALASGCYYKQTINSQADVRTESGLNPFLYVRFYPSPVVNVFHAQFDGTYTVPGGLITAGLYDILGREVLDLSPLANLGNNGITSMFTADVSSLSSGVYSLHYQLGTSSFTHGLIIIH